MTFQHHSKSRNSHLTTPPDQYTKIQSNIGFLVLTPNDPLINSNHSSPTELLIICFTTYEMMKELIETCEVNKREYNYNQSKKKVMGQLLPHRTS